MPKPENRSENYQGKRQRLWSDAEWKHTQPHGCGVGRIASPRAPAVSVTSGPRRAPQAVPTVAVRCGGGDQSAGGEVSFHTPGDTPVRTERPQNVLENH